MKSYRTWINQSFSRRISAFFIPVILTLLLTVGGVSFYIYYSSVLNETRQNTVGIVEQRNFTVDLYVKDIKSTVAALKDNEDIIYMLKNYENMTVVDKFYRQERIDELLMNTGLVRDHILDCIIVGKNGYRTNMPDRYNLRYDVDLLEEDWLQPYLEAEKQKFYFTPSHENDYYFTQNGTARSAVSVIFPMGNRENWLGYMIVDMDFQKMNELISVNSETKNLQFMVADEMGNIIFSDKEEEVNGTLPKEVCEKLETSKTFQFTKDGEGYFCVHEKSDSTGWELLGIIPLKVMARPAANLLKILCFVVLPLFVLITVVLSDRIAKKIKEPLEEIVEQTEKVDINQPQPFHVTDSVAEVEHLANKFTEMIERINQLVRLVYVAEMRKKDAQIEALISQINPHFLYNTLQLIKTEAAMGEPREVSATVNCLSRFLRYTINNQEYYVPLREELAHIGYYMEIYKKRFPDKYVLEIEADDRAGEFMVPKLILQPFVENAIKHGLRQKEGTGIIRVRAELMENPEEELKKDIKEDIKADIKEDLLLCIEDNGVGMDEEDAEKLLKSIELPLKDGESHVGLRNVNERIRLSAKEGYGIIRIESRKNEYFKVYLKIQKGQEHV